MRTKYASADGKYRDNESYSVKSNRHREGTILVAQSKFVKETMNQERLEHIDHERE